MQQVILTDTQVGYIRAMARAGLDLEEYFLLEMSTDLKRVALDLWYRERRTSLSEVVVAKAADNIGVIPSQLGVSPIFHTRTSKRGRHTIAAMVGCVV